MAVSAAKIIGQIFALSPNVRYVAVRMGDVHPIAAGHLSIAIAPHADPLVMLAPVRAILARERLLPPCNKP